MCGIVAYWGKQDQVLDTLIAGLRRLEYRGYDSAGIALNRNDETIFCKKTVGRVLELEKALVSENNQVSSSLLTGVGIAHTRWATHGVPSVLNAHPHSSNDNKIWVVHNGIIENYKELKNQLQSEGVVFESETDTEVIGHLVRKFYKNNLREAVLLVLKELHGAFAIAVTISNEAHRLIAAKKGSPLVLGVGSGEYILASDVSAIISKTREVIYLEDNELVDITENGFQIVNFENQAIEKQLQSVEWDEEAASKEGYDHFLLKEIMEQPKAMLDAIRGRLVPEEADIRFGGLIDVRERLPEINKVVLLGIGTSYFACRLGEMYFEKLAGITAKAEMSPEYRYKDTLIDDKTWVIAVSQSGETADTISSIMEAKKKGALVTGIVNVVGSTISRITDAGVYQHVGPEMSVASTKAFTSAAIILLMHAILLGRMKGLGFSEASELIKEIEKIPDYITQVLGQNEEIKKVASKYFKAKNMMYIGRKFNYPIAQEGAIKIKEISYIHVEAFSGGELKHGPIALIDEDVPTVSITTQDSVYEKQVSNIQEVIARKGPVIVVANFEDTKIQEITPDILRVPKSESEETQAIISNISLQLFAYHCANFLELDIDKPRNLAKSVTVE